MNIRVKLYLWIGLIISFVGADIGNPSVHEIAVGGRALGVAGNCVVGITDFSAVFYNPAALSFMPVRQIQLSLDGLGTKVTTHSSGSRNRISKQRILFGNAGIIRAFPTTRGGFTIAAGYQTPYVFDDAFKRTITIGNTINSSDYRCYGKLGFWSAAFGIQVAPGLGTGAALSLLTGNLEVAYNRKITTDATIVDPINHFFEIKTSRQFLGYDFRGGIIYSPNDLISFGMRITMPRTVTFSGTYEEFYPLKPDSSISVDDPGKLRSPLEGAFGLSLGLPFVKISPQFMFRSPDASAPEGADLAKWKIGAGTGLELPLLVSTLLLRTGYRWKQYDSQPFSITYENPSVNEPLPQRKILSNEHFISSGLAYLVQETISFELSAGYTYWEFEDNSVVTHRQRLFQGVFSVSFRY